MNHSQHNSFTPNNHTEKAPDRRKNTTLLLGVGAAAAATLIAGPKAVNLLEAPAEASSTPETPVTTIAVEIQSESTPIDVITKAVVEQLDDPEAESRYSQEIAAATIAAQEANAIPRISQPGDMLSVTIRPDQPEDTPESDPDDVYNFTVSR